MDRLFDIGFLVFSQLAVGGAFLMNLLDVRIMGKALFRTNGIIFLMSMMLSLFFFSFNHSLSVSDGTWILVFFALYIFFLVIHLLTLWSGGEKFRKWALWLAGITGLFGLVVTGVGYSHHMSQSSFIYLLPLNFCVSAFLMGSGLVGMNLGHCYLTNIHLPISPYKKMSLLFLFFLLFQAILTALGLVQFNDPHLIKKAVFLENMEGLFLWIRILVGFLGPLILIFMIIHTVKIRSTQSATGLMYIAMMMVISGEFFSRFFLLASQKLI
ncbi:MAG: hypothetical protein ACYDBV_06905 [Nitrospiria bacterium]